MGVAGYNAVVKISGAYTASTGNAMSTIAASTVFEAGTLFQIDSTAREVWDRTTLPTFYEGGSTVASSDVVFINYLFGRVQFATTKSSTAGVTVDMTYLPVANVAGAHTYTLSQNADMLDDTDFTSTGFRSRFPGLQDVSLSINRWEKLDAVFSKAIFGADSTRYEDGTIRLVAEVRPGGGSNPYGRGYFVLETNTLSADVASLEDADISLQIDGDTNAAFRWSDLLP